MEKYYTIKQIAEILQVKTQTVSTWIRKGELKVTRINKRNVRISQSQLDEYLQTQGGNNYDER